MLDQLRSDVERFRRDAQAAYSEIDTLRAQIAAKEMEAELANSMENYAQSILTGFEREAEERREKMRAVSLSKKKQTKAVGKAPVAPVDASKEELPNE